MGALPPPSPFQIDPLVLKCIIMKEHVIFYILITIPQPHILLLSSTCLSQSAQLSNPESVPEDCARF